MRFPPDGPSYRRFVFGFALWAGVGMFLFIYTWVAMIVVFVGGFVPSIDELNAVGAHWLATLAYGITLFTMIFYQNSRWLETFRQPQQQKPDRPPQPRFYSSHTDMRNHVRLQRANDYWIPQAAAHYKAIYNNLRMQEWRITRAALDVKWGRVKAIPNLTKNFVPAMEHWNSFGFIGGWETGDANIDTWYLNEKGQAWLLEESRTGATSPTE